MVEQQRQRVEQEMTRMVNEIDKEYLRKMQADMHRCAATCCDDYSVSLDSVQRCVETCGNSLNKTQAYIQKELENFQGRLQRCIMDCNDTVKDKMGPNPSDSDVNKYTLMFENCAVKCVDKHLELIPTVMKAIKTVISNQEKQKK